MIPVHPVTPKSEQGSGRFVTATNHLTNRSEPADTELGSAGAGGDPDGTGTDQERGDGGVELCRHRLHPPLVQRLSFVAGAILQEADGRGVALERLVRERIDLQRSSRWRNRTSLLVGEW